jgi:hypothetical protein
LWLQGLFWFSTIPECHCSILFTIFEIIWCIMVEGASYAFSRQSTAALVVGEVFSVAGATVPADGEAVPVKCVAFPVSFMKLFL